MASELMKTKKIVGNQHTYIALAKKESPLSMELYILRHFY